MKCEKCEGKGFIEYESGTIMVECECQETKEIDDSGTERGNTNLGSADTSKPQLKRKPKAKKRATKKPK